MRAATAEDLAQAAGLLAGEGWSFEPPELARLLDLGGGAAAVRDGAVAGFLTWVDLPPCRWIGNVVVHPAARGHGLGERLVRAALASAPARLTPGLYAVEKAVTLYARLGFRPHGEAYALRADAPRPVRTGSEDVAVLREDDLEEAAALDKRWSGMDRAALLRALHRAFPGSAVGARRDGRLVGFGLLQPTPGGTELGPVVAEPDSGAAEALVDALLARAEGPVDATVLGAAPAAERRLAQRGFARAFRVVPMFAGDAPAWIPAALAAAAGLEKS